MALQVALPMSGPVTASATFNPNIQPAKTIRASCPCCSPRPRGRLLSMNSSTTSRHSGGAARRDLDGDVPRPALRK